MDYEFLTPDVEHDLGSDMGLHTSTSRQQDYLDLPPAGPGSVCECPGGNPKGTRASVADACMQAPDHVHPEHLHMPQAATATVIELFPHAGAEGQPPPSGAPVTILEAPYRLEAWMAETRGMVLVDACIPITALESLVILLKRPGHWLEVDDSGQVVVKTA